MDKVVMTLEIGRIDKRLDGLKEWRDQLNERIADLERRRQELLEATESKP